ncbi:MAG: TIGR04255 family protein [Leptolyngbya sp. RL_3_1]|nr:TIGR04255 family protein [Leptolyngbya sp. RL_3_1]
MLVIPDSERVIYGKSPLFEVICQVRFPTILKIGQGEPVDFQEEIRGDYPIFSISAPQMPEELKNTLKVAGIGIPIESSSYEFKSEDGSWKISLTKEFIAITTTAYRKFEDFKSRFELILKIFNNVYRPSFFSRIGLRYQDLIVRSAIGLEDLEWNALISKNLAFELHDPAISRGVKYYMKNFSFVIGEQESLSLKHGIVEATIGKSKEDGYLIDSDFFSTKKVVSTDELFDTLSGLNRKSGRLFRWSITDRLHAAMEPTVLA